MQIGYPRWPPEAVTKNSKNTKMTISQKSVIGVRPSLFQNDPCIKPFGFFREFGISSLHKLLLLR